MPIEDSQQILTPLYPDQDEDTIRARWEAWANEGLTISDVNEWVDTRPGSFWYIATSPGIQEAARLYDLAGLEVPGAAMVVWSWGEYLDDIAEGLSLERLPATQAEGTVTFTGTNGTVIGAGVQVAVGGGAEGQEYAVVTGGTIGGGGTIDLLVRAIELGAAGNTPANTVTVLQSTIAAVSAVNNADRLLGGSDPETDEALRERCLIALADAGPGTRKDYEIWARSYPGVGRATVIPLWDGPGTVLVIALTVDGGPVSGGVVSGLQAYLDPTAGAGGGRAPVGAEVTVVTAASVTVNVIATIEFGAGYSLDGAAGTIALRATIREAIRDYIEKIPPGGEVTIRKIIGRIVGTVGVSDTGSVSITAPPETLEGNGNLILASSPSAKVGLLGTTTFTAGPV